MLVSVCMSVCCGMARASASQQIVVLGGDHHESGGLEPRRHLAWPLLASPGLSVCQCVHGVFARELPATTSTTTAVHWVQSVDTGQVFQDLGIRPSTDDPPLPAVRPTLFLVRQLTDLYQ